MTGTARSGAFIPVDGANHREYNRLLYGDCRVRFQHAFHVNARIDEGELELEEGVSACWVLSTGCLTILVDDKEGLDKEEEEEPTEAAPADGRRTPLPLATSFGMTPAVSTVAPQGSRRLMFSSCGKRPPRWH